MSKKLFVSLVVAVYVLGLAISGPLNIGVSSAAKPISGAVSLYITGHIRILSAPARGVRVILVSTNKRSTLITETRTDTDGVYRFNSLNQGRYIIQPQDERYTFSPLQQLVNLVKQPFDNIDFLAIPR